jgi:hypothetical protein
MDERSSFSTASPAFGIVTIFLEGQNLHINSMAFQTVTVLYMSSSDFCSWAVAQVPFYILYNCNRYKIVPKIPYSSHIYSFCTNIPFLHLGNWQFVFSLFFFSLSDCYRFINFTDFVRKLVFSHWIHLYCFSWFYVIYFDSLLSFLLLTFILLFSKCFKSELRY